MTDSAISSQELACIYSAAILADDDIPVTADKMVTLIKAAGVAVEPVWPALYAKALQTIDIKQYITKVGASPLGVGGVAGAGTTAGDSAGDKDDATPAAAADEEESEDDDDMGLSLFD